MKKTQNEQPPQFIRNRSGSLPDLRLDTQNLGSISRNSPRAIRHRKRKFQQFSVLFACILFVSFLGIFWVNNKPNTNSASSLSISSLSISSLSSDNSTVESSLEIITNGDSSETAIIQPGNADSIVSVDRIAAFSTLKESITSFVEGVNGRVGVYYVNLQTDEAWGLNEKEPFVAASSIKLGINTLLYKQIAQGDFKFTDMLAYDNRAYPAGDREEGTGSVIGQPNGTQFSVRRTSQLSITISDNCATNMVIRKLGGIDAIAPYLTGISGEVPYRTAVSYTDYSNVVKSGRHRTSAKDLALYAKNLYSLWKASPKDYDPLMEDLQNTVFTFGIQAKLPATVKVAHKIGTNGDWKTENDAGIVFAKEPFVICVTTENPSQAAGREAVAEISLKVYNYIQGLS